jgi:hypothetical protein
LNIIITSGANIVIIIQVALVKKFFIAYLKSPLHPGLIPYSSLRGGTLRCCTDQVQAKIVKRQDQRMSKTVLVEETSDSRKAVAFCDMVVAYLGSIIWDGAIGKHFG